MGCALVTVADGIGFVCGGGVQPCHSCGQVADYLCDYPIGDGKTCDLPLCEECRHKVADPHNADSGIDLGDGFDLCPTHVALLKEW